MASTTTAEISRLDIQDLVTPPLASITNVKQLSSYNWIEAPTPTIAVPGCPPLWSAPRVPTRVKKDSGLTYIAQNAARHPDSPLEPLFRALFITNPSYDIRSIDVVTDRNNIRKLLSFINPSSSRNGLEAFTISIEITKNTAIFCREETKTSEFIGPHEFRGFGHQFEKAYTTDQINGSTGHHRIISYRFGDLNFIIRHETDGYTGADTKIPSSNTIEPENDILSGMLGSLSLSSNNSLPKASPAEAKLTVKEEGQVVSLESTLEVKTRVSHKPLGMQEVTPQLWVSQTPKLVRAYHYKGTFQPPEVEDATAEIQRWEERNQNDLKKLAALIKKIFELAKECGGKADLKYDAKGDKVTRVARQRPNNSNAHSLSSSTTTNKFHKHIFSLIIATDTTLKTYHKGLHSSIHTTNLPTTSQISSRSDPGDAAPVEINCPPGTPLIRVPADTPVNTRAKDSFLKSMNDAFQTIATRPYDEQSVLINIASAMVTQAQGTRDTVVRKLDLGNPTPNPPEVPSDGDSDNEEEETGSVKDDGEKPDSVDEPTTDNETEDVTASEEDPKDPLVSIVKFEKISQPVMSNKIDDLTKSRNEFYKDLASNRTIIQDNAKGRTKALNITNYIFSEMLGRARGRLLQIINEHQDAEVESAAKPVDKVETKEGSNSIEPRGKLESGTT